MATLILSDSHGNRDQIKFIMQKHEGEITTWIHCGDGQLPEGDSILQAFACVRGNCDFDLSLPEEIFITKEGMKIFATHGHLIGVNYSLHNLAERALENNCQIACYGHTHRWMVEKVNGVICINPGSIVQPRGRKEKSYAILQRGEYSVQINFYDIHGYKFLSEEIDL